MELFLLYFWLKLDSIISIATGLGWMAGLFISIAGIIVFVAGIEHCENDTLSWLTRMVKKAVFLFVFAIILVLLLPSTKQMAILVGANFALDAVHSPEGQKVTSLLRLKANEILDAEIVKLTTPTEKK
jgi:hypothetical protein